MKTVKHSKKTEKDYKKKYGLTIKKIILSSENFYNKYLKSLKP